MMHAQPMPSWLSQAVARKNPMFRGTRPMACALLCAAVIGQPAEARRSFHRRSHDERPVEKAEAKKPPVGPVYAVVSIADQHVSFYDAKGLWARSTISSGVDAHPTPTGVFTILEKERWHRSNIYSGAPMPFMQRLTWTGVAMHEGHVTGRLASHGCIRMPGAFARQVFSLTKEGQRVIVANKEVVPSDIVHANLPVPKLQSLPESPVANGTAAQTGKAFEPVALDAPAPSVAAKPLNPVEFAKASKLAAEARIVQAQKDKKSASALLEGKAPETRTLARELAIGEAAVKRARDEVEEANRAIEKAQGDEAGVRRTNDRKTAADTRLAAAEEKLKAVRDASAAMEKDNSTWTNGIREADAAIRTASEQLKASATRLEPVSMFISRKTGRLYVRQATQHLFDMPVAIRDPERRIGTHLFIATEAGSDGASLRWVALTPPAAAEVKIKPRSSRRGRHIEPEEDQPAPAAFPESAAGALDRIDIPAEARERIAALLWTGATLVVSDVGMSGEGRFAMDFQILNRTLVREE